MTGRPPEFEPPPAARDRYPAAWPTLVRWWRRPLAQYRAALAGPSADEAPPGPVIAAFERALLRVHGPDPRVSAALDGLRRARLLATTHHVAATYGPASMAWDRQLVAGPPPIVGAWSGIPLNNSALPACLTLAGDPRSLLAAPARAPVGEAPSGEGRLWMVRHHDRHRLLFRAPLDPRVAETLDRLADPLRALPGPRAGDDLPTWALRFCAALQARALGRPPPLTVDLNAVAADLLAGLIEAGAHPVARMFTDPRTRDALAAALPDEVWFAVEDRAGRRPRVDGLMVRGDRLEGRRVTLPLAPAAIVEGLRRGRLCPGLLPTYAALRVYGRLRCLGGLRQAGYLARFDAAWARLPGWPPAPVERGPTLLDGRMPAPGLRYAIDFARAGRTAVERLADDAPMAALWGPLMARWLG